MERKRKVVKPGVILIDNHRNGVVVSNNTDSPWNKATYYQHGSVLSDAEGKFIRQVAFCETIDPDGDVTWSARAPRVDGYKMPTYKMSWEIDEKNDETIPPFIPKVPYTNHATSLSFHGPHVTEAIKELDNGLRLIINTQIGVLIGEDSTESNVLNPRGYAASYDKGVTVWRGDKRLADVMLLEDTDPDGDMAWLVHVWWYARGRGLYKFVGGTGKWEGIRGEGTTLGQLMKRTDDYHLLRSEIHWRIDNIS